MDWRPGALFLDRPHYFCFLRDGEGKIEEGHLVRDGERILPGMELVLVDCIICVGHRVFPDRRRLTLAPGTLQALAESPGSGSRFDVLGADNEDLDPDAERAAVQADDMVLSGENHEDDGDLGRPCMGGEGRRKMNWYRNFGTTSASRRRRRVFGSAVDQRRLLLLPAR